MMDGLIVRALRCFTRWFKQHDTKYTKVGLDVHASGGKGHEINEPWEA